MTWCGGGERVESRQTWKPWCAWRAPANSVWLEKTTTFRRKRAALGGDIYKMKSNVAATSVWLLLPFHHYYSTAAFERGKKERRKNPHTPRPLSALKEKKSTTPITSQASTDHRKISPSPLPKCNFRRSLNVVLNAHFLLPEDQPERLGMRKKQKMRIRFLIPSTCPAF